MSRSRNAWLRPIACGLAALIASAVTVPAEAARLVVHGPAGARVRIDGRDAGVLPLPGPLDLLPGSHEVRLDLAGYQPETLRARSVVENEHVELRFTLRPVDRGRAALSSVLLAGSGQRRVGRPTLGWVMTGTEVAGIAAAITGEAWFRSERDKWHEASDRYDTAVDPDDIAAARTDVDAAYDAMGDAERLRNIGIGVAVGAVAWSVLDVLLRAPSGPGAPAADPGAAGGDLGIWGGSREQRVFSVRPWCGPDAAYGCALRARF